jgi:hypothetical protein
MAFSLPAGEEALLMQMPAVTGRIFEACICPLSKSMGTSARQPHERDGPRSRCSSLPSSMNVRDKIIKSAVDQTKYKDVLVGKPKRTIIQVVTS